MSIRDLRVVVCPTCSGRGKPGLWKRVMGYKVCPQCAGRRVLPESHLDPKRGRTEPRVEASDRQVAESFTKVPR